jgi:DNA repair ATPase RecN
MKKLFALAAFSIAFIVLSADTSFGQKVWYSGDVKATAQSLESNTDKFAEALNKSMDASWVDGKDAQDQINHFVDQFEEATDKLEQKVEDQKAAPKLFDEVVYRAKIINAGMNRYKVSAEAEAYWAAVRKDINTLGKSYKIVVKW